VRVISTPIIIIIQLFDAELWMAGEMFQQLPGTWSQWAIPPAGQSVKLWKMLKVGKTSQQFLNVKQNVNATCTRVLTIDSVSVIL